VINELPDPVLTQVYRLKAVMGPPQDFADGPASHRWVVPLVGGIFTGPELNGNLQPGGSVSWRITLPDGAAVADIRYTLRTGGGALLRVRSAGAIHGSNDMVAEGLRSGADVASGEHLFHAATHIETAARDLNWLNWGVFVTVTRPTVPTMLCETYLVG